MGMAGAGAQRLPSITAAGSLIATMDTGCIPTTDGTGGLAIRGDGRLSIMADGSAMRVMAGAGGRIPSGLPRGYAGGTTGAIAAGRHYRPIRGIGLASGLFIVTAVSWRGLSLG